MKRLKRLSSVLFLSILISGCATSSIQSRKQEKFATYNVLSADQQQLVDEGKIKIGMPPDAVYIAWGPPSEVLESETTQGHIITWIYHGQWMEESRYWTYREVSRDGSPFLERYLESDYFPRNYIRAEITFANNAVIQWRTLPRLAP